MDIGLVYTEALLLSLEQVPLPSLLNLFSFTDSEDKPGFIMILVLFFVVLSIVLIKRDGNALAKYISRMWSGVIMPKIVFRWGEVLNKSPTYSDDKTKANSKITTRTVSCKHPS